MNRNVEKFDEIKEFDFSISYLEYYKDNVNNINVSHFHEECEVYINLSGDVDFMVEDKIYPINAGDIIITRPFEYHHCIYRSNKLHKHFWILFSTHRNEFLFDTFFKRKVGKGNKLVLSSDDTKELIRLCHTMNGFKGDISQKYYNFFKFINLLQSAGVVKNVDETYPPDVIYATNYISKYFNEQIKVEEIAKKANVSVNTLERHFRNTLSITPAAYIQKKRLANAAKLLSMGSNVTEAAMESGFFDTSNFICLFKRNYSMTPLEYKKHHKN